MKGHTADFGGWQGRAELARRAALLTPIARSTVFKEPSPIHEASTQADGGTRRFGNRRLWRICST